MTVPEHLDESPLWNIIYRFRKGQNRSLQIILYLAANIKTPCRAWSPDHATACCTAHQKSATNPAPSVRRSALTPPFTPIFLYAKNFATNCHQTYCCHKHSCKLALFLFQGPASPHRLAFPHPPHSRGLSRGLRNAALWRSLRHCVPPPCSSIPNAAPDRAFLK